MDFFANTTSKSGVIRVPKKKVQIVPPPQVFKKKPRVKVRKIEDQDNIQHIHEQVLSFFDEELRKIEGMENYKSQLKWINKHGLSKYERNQALKQIKKVDHQIFELRNERRKTEYLRLTKPILEKYKIEIRKPIKIDFLSNKVTNNEEKDQIVNAFLNLAEQHISIERKKNENDGEAKCTECQGEELIHRNGNVICIECGLEEQILITTDASFKDIDRVNTSSRYEYDRHTHFRDAINNIQGKQNVKIKDEIYDILNQCVKQNKMSNVTPEHLLLFMKENGLSKYYDHVYLIHKRMTGIDCAPNISMYETELYIRHEMILPIYNEVKPKDKKNFINAHYVLLQILRQLGWEPHRTDYEILKTRDKLIEHDDTWLKICERLNSPQSPWVFYPTV